MPPSPTRSRLPVFFWGQIVLALVLKTAYFVSGETHPALLSYGVAFFISGFLGERLYARERKRTSSSEPSSEDGPPSSRADT